MTLRFCNHYLCGRHW